MIWMIIIILCCILWILDFKEWQLILIYLIIFLKYIYFIKIGCQTTTNKHKIISWFPLFDDSGMKLKIYIYNYIKTKKNSLLEGKMKMKGLHI